MHHHTRLAATLIAAFLSLPASAQKECHATHDDGTLIGNTVTGGVPIAYKITFPSAMTVVAIQVHTGLRDGPGSVSIYSHDAATNMPVANLSGKGTYSQIRPESWQGALLPTPTSVTAGQTLWVVWEAPNSSRTNWSTAPNGTIYYRGFINGAWNGPAAGWGPKPVKIRFFCTYQTGKVQRIGLPKAGASGVVPTLDLGGWPSVGNELAFVLANAMPNAPAVFVIGRPATIPFVPLLTLYAQPDATLTLTTSAGRNPGDGGGLAALRVPDDPALIGLALSSQYVVVDSPTPLDIAHTDGVVFVLN